MILWQIDLDKGERSFQRFFESCILLYILHILVIYTEVPANKIVRNRERTSGYETKSSTENVDVLFDDGNEWKRLITDLENIETNKEEPKMIEPKIPQHVTHHHDSIDKGRKIFKIMC